MGPCVFWATRDATLGAKMLLRVENEFLCFFRWLPPSQGGGWKLVSAVGMAWSAQWYTVSFPWSFSLECRCKNNIIFRFKEFIAGCCLSSDIVFDGSSAASGFDAASALHRRYKILSWVQIFQLWHPVCLINYKSWHRFTASLAFDSSLHLPRHLQWESERTRGSACLATVHKFNCSEQIHISCLWFFCLAAPQMLKPLFFTCFRGVGLLVGSLKCFVV